MNGLNATMPWTDARGRFSWFKAAALVALVLPALWMIGQIGNGTWAFPSPFVGLIYHSGVWTTWLLLATLAITPLRHITGFARLTEVRRSFGVATCLYCLVHVFAWFGLRAFDWDRMLAEDIPRPSIWFAGLAFMILLALTVTSLDRAIRRMGPARWKRLHRLVYTAGILGVAHFLLSPGSLYGKPFLALGLLVWLLGWRVLDRRGRGGHAPALALLGVIATLATLLFEPFWLATFQSERAEAAPLAAIAATFDLERWRYLGVPPTFVMLGFSTVLTILAALRPKRARPAGKLVPRR